MRNKLTGVTKSTKKLTRPIKATNRPRNPPPPPTPVQLPTIDLSKFSSTPKLTADELFEIIASFPRYGPKPEHAQALGIKLTCDATLEDLIQSAHLPPSTWLSEPSPTAASSTFPAASSIKATGKLGNGKTVPDQAAFWKIYKELPYPNDVAFRFIDRHQLTMEKNVYIAHFRKFWESLEQIATHWDASKDEYHSPSPGTDDKQTYTGMRVGNGENMPARYREEAILQFVQQVVYLFDCRVERPSSDSKLQVGGMNVPAGCSSVVYRFPMEVEKRKRRIVQGPVLGLSARNAVKFRQEGEQPGEGKLECLDVVREVGIALNLAQKRAREGKAEVKTWEGKWWAEKPRWGGGEGMLCGSHLIRC